MKIKTSELKRVQLDWAVAMSQGLKPIMRHTHLRNRARTNNVKDEDLMWHLSVQENLAIHVNLDQSTETIAKYHSDWSHGGPIIERERISLIRCDDEYIKDKEGFTTNKRKPVWFAEHGGGHSTQESYGRQGDYFGEAFHIAEDGCYGPTPLIAAMRCYVASKLGDEVEIPEELL